MSRSKETFEWINKQLKSNPVEIKTEVVCVDKDEYCLYLEEKILKLEEQIKKNHYKSFYNIAPPLGSSHYIIPYND